MITWWNNTIFINTFFAIPTWSGIHITSDDTFLRSAFVEWSTIVIYWTFLGNADFVPTLIFICAVIVVFTSLVTFSQSAICQNGASTFFATPNKIIAWSSWISNISIGYSPQQILLTYLCEAMPNCEVNHTEDYLAEWNNSNQYSFCHLDIVLYVYTQWYIFLYHICCLVHNHFVCCKLEEYIFFRHKIHHLGNLECFCIVECICNPHKYRQCHNQGLSHMILLNFKHIYWLQSSTKLVYFC